MSTGFRNPTLVRKKKKKEQPAVPFSVVRCYLQTLDPFPSDNTTHSIPSLLLRDSGQSFLSVDGPETASNSSVLCSANAFD